MVNIALVGLGYWGSKLARAIIRTPGLDLVWLVEPNVEVLDRQKLEFPGVQCSVDLDFVLDDRAVEAVAIATPANTHRELAIKCLDKGKHLFVEKPLSLSLKDARSIVKKADQSGRTLMVGHTFLYNEAVIVAKKIIEDDSMGDLQYLNFSRTNLGPIRPDTNVVWDLAAHDISMALWLTSAVPLSVSARGAAWINPGREDFATIWLEFPKNICAQVTVSWLSPERVRRFNVVGSRGMLSVDDANQATPLVFHSKYVSDELVHFANLENREDVRLTPIDEGSLILDFSWSEPLVNQLGSFVESVTTGATPQSDGAFGLSVVTVLEAVQHSMRKRGSPVAIT